MQILNTEAIAMNLSLCCLQLLCFHLIPIFQPRVDIREWRRWGFIEGYYQLSFLVSKSRAYKAAAMGICCIAIEELRKELISLLSRLDHIDAFIHYIRNYALADHASMGICHYAIEISN